MYRGAIKSRVCPVQMKCEMSNEEKLREIAVASGTPIPGGGNGKNSGEQISPNTQARSKFSSQQGFTPKVGSITSF